MFDPNYHGSIEAARSPFDLLARAVQRAAQQGVGDVPELDPAIVACARDARDAAWPPQRFVVQIKACVRRATVRAAPHDVGPLMFHVVARAVDAYYNPSRA